MPGRFGAGVDGAAPGLRLRSVAGATVVLVLLSPGCLDAFTAADAWQMSHAVVGPGDRLTVVGAPEGTMGVWNVDPWTGNATQIPVAVPGTIGRAQWGREGNLFVVSRTADGESVWRIGGDGPVRSSPPQQRIRALSTEGQDLYALLHNGPSIRLPGEANPVPLVDLYRLTPGGAVRLTNESWTEANGIALVSEGALFLDVGVRPGDYDDAPLSARFFLWSIGRGLEQALSPSLQAQWKGKAIQWACRDPADPGLVQLRSIPYATSDAPRETMLFRPMAGAVDAQVAIPENGCLMGQRDQLIVYEDSCGQFSCQDSLRRVDLATGTATGLLT